MTQRNDQSGTTPGAGGAPSGNDDLTALADRILDLWEDNLRAHARMEAGDHHTAERDDDRS
ncbi:hypothetical protein [Yunchengibacter salinarum]|uniref:hypothetical protein n=1 Tax=Yunchengibacter salinarum TaxID=3133399 RepID=UPI0035B63587